MITFRVIIISLLASCNILAQESNTYFHHLTVENGLSNATNYFFFNDSRGYIWISSTSGLNRFDGRQVRVYQPESADSASMFGQNIQSNFFEDGNSDIWFCTYEKINKYNRKTDQFEYFSILDDNKSPFIGYRIAGMDANKCLWILAGEQYVYVFNTITKQYVKKHKVNIRSEQLILQKNANNQVVRSFAGAWSVGNYGMQMTEYFEKDSIKQTQLFDKLSSYPLSIYDLFFEKEHVWIASDKGLHNFNLQTKVLKDFPLNDYAVSISSTDNDRFLISTGKSGILMFDKQNGKIIKRIEHTQNNSHSLTTNSTFTSKIDSDNNLLVHVRGAGIDYTNLFKNKFNIIQSNLLSSNLSQPFDVHALIIDTEGNLWTGSKRQGIRKFAEKGVLSDSFIAGSRTAKGLKSNNVTQVFIGKYNRVWFLSMPLLYYYDTQKNIFNYVNTNEIACLYGLNTKAGKILLVAYTGIYELNENKNAPNTFTRIEKIPYDNPHTIIFEDNDTWLWGGYNAVSIRAYNTLKNYELVKELPINGVITGFWHQPNTPNVWVSSQNGLYKIDKTTWQYIQLTEKDGLPSRTINTMQADANNNLWLGTSKGLAKYETATRKVFSYNLVDGISDLNFNMYASTQASDGTMYFGTSNGITTFHPKNIIPLSIQARPTITNILINDEQAKNLVCTTTGATNISEIQSLKLPFSQNTLSFTFSAMEYSDPIRCKFEYKMDGLDDKWVQTSTQNFARYASLSAGTYRFFLKASNSDGVFNETPRILEIIIIPPFYKTWWFIALSLLATMALIAYIVYLRLSKVIALQKIRLNLYENLHDDIGSRLTAIVLIVDELVKKATIKEPKLDRVGTISRNIVANMRRLVWATAPENDALSTVAQQMQSDRRQLLPSGTHFTLKMDNTLENLNIGGDKRYQMLSIFNEALTNIAKYAEATAVETWIEIQDKDLIMTIVDNGQGFDPLKPREDSVLSSGHGLRNMQRRANRIKGSLDISSKLGEGTIIKLSFPMKDETVWVKFLDLLGQLSKRFGGS